MNIANNRKAFHDYSIEDTFEAGVVLQGWEVKSIRNRNVQLKDSYIKIINQEMWILGLHITPLISISSHITPDPIRNKKLLMHKRDIQKLNGKITQKGYTLIALDLHYNHGLIKANIGLAKGKTLYDKRHALKERELNQEKARIIKTYKT